jgi:hypothetical protein
VEGPKPASNHGADVTPEVHEEACKKIKIKIAQRDTSCELNENQTQTLKIENRCGNRPEVDGLAKTHAHIKRIMTNQPMEAGAKKRGRVGDAAAWSWGDVVEDGERAEEEEEVEEIDVVPQWRSRDMAPSDWDAKAEGAKAKKVPLPHVEVEYVYGYRGRDCHGNLVWSRDGLAAFHVSTMGVGMDVSTGAQYLFRGHSSGRGVITCIALHPDGVTVATGEAGGAGGGGGIFVWSSAASNGGHLAHKEGALRGGVQSIAFANGGAWVVAAGGDWPRQELVVIDWNVNPAQIMARIPLGQDRVFSLCASPFSDHVVVCGGRGLSVVSSPSTAKEGLRERIADTRMKLTVRSQVGSRMHACMHRNCFAGLCIPLLTDVDVYIHASMTRCALRLDFFFLRAVRLNPLICGVWAGV